MQTCRPRCAVMLRLCQKPHWHTIETAGGAEHPNATPWRGHASRKEALKDSCPSVNQAQGKQPHADRVSTMADLSAASSCLQSCFKSQSTGSGEQGGNAHITIEIDVECRTRYMRKQQYRARSTCIGLWCHCLLEGYRGPHHQLLINQAQRHLPAHSLHRSVPVDAKNGQRPSTFTASVSPRNAQWTAELNDMHCCRLTGSCRGAALDTLRWPPGVLTAAAPAGSRNCKPRSCCGHSHV